MLLLYLILILISTKKKKKTSFSIIYSPLQADFNSKVGFVDICLWFCHQLLHTTDNCCFNFKGVIFNHCHYSVKDQVSCIISFISMAFFETNILKLACFCLLLKIKLIIFAPREKFLLMVLNSPPHIAWIYHVSY